LKEKKKNIISLAGIKNAFKLFKFIVPYKLEFGIGLFFLLGSGLTNLAFPKLLGDLVNAGTGDNIEREINEVAFILAGVIVLQALFSFFRVVLFARVSEKTLASLRQFTYNHLIRLPLKFFDKRRVGELNSRISSDISLLQETLTTTLADFIRQMIIIIGGITLLVITSPQLTLFMLSVLPAVVILTFFFGRYVRKFSKQAQNEVAESNTIVEETLQGIRSVKAYTNEKFEMLRYKKRTEKISKIGIKGGTFRAAFASFIILGLFGSLIAVIWKGSLLMAAGDINSGELFSFVLYSGFIGGTIGGLANVISQIQKFLGATEDLFEILETEQEDIKQNDNIEHNDLLKGEIEIKNLRFAYPSRTDLEVLKDINMTIKTNQMIALVGASGAGKSTLSSLLLQYYKVDEGQLFFDGRDCNKIPLSVLRNQIALVPQDIFLFGGSIRENIAYGKPHANEEEIRKAAKLANALEFIDQFPEGLDTVVGERGTQLSGGQRQRVAIARAILKNPKILILDEATSALDSKSEKLVQEALENLMKGRTSVVIAHRLSTVKNAQMIYVLDQGKIVEMGTHEELILHEDGIYKNLSELQNIGQ
jgi:ABC-type multidrug transport system fused ATPase/permease subunit